MIPTAIVAGAFAAIAAVALAVEYSRAGNLVGACAGFALAPLALGIWPWKRGKTGVLFWLVLAGGILVLASAR